MNSYLKLCTEFYDRDKPNPPADALAFYLKEATAADGLVVEPMCGSGRFLVPLLEARLDVIGADASPHMLAACQEKIRERGLTADVRQQFLHELDISPRGEAAVVFIPSGSFQLLTDQDQVRGALRRIHSILKPGGVFLFESAIGKPAESSSWPWGGRWITRPDGAKLLISWLGRYDAATSINYNIHKYELFEEGRLLATEFEELDLRHYSAEELHQLLTEAGFSDIRMFKPYDRSHPAVIGSDEMMIECHRGSE